MPENICLSLFTHDSLIVYVQALEHAIELHLFIVLFSKRLLKNGKLPV